MTKAICDACNKAYSIECGDLEWDVTSYEKHSESMGAEVHYNSEWEEICDCGNNMNITFFYVEYPQGFLELDDTKTSGCTLEGDCNPV